VTANRTVTVTATSVADTTKQASATVTVQAAAIGTLTMNPASITFGSVVVGQTSSILTTTLTNTGSAALTITSDSISGDFGWGGTGTCNYGPIAAGSSCTYSVKFTPTASGTRSGSITINSTASNATLTIPLSGTGTGTAGTLAVTPAPLGIGSVVVGMSGTALGSLVASGAGVTVTAVSSNNARFSLSGLSLPVTIPAGQSVGFTLTFTPQTTGAVSAVLTFTSNAQSSSTAETVTGTGTPAPVHTVNLSWNASTSTNVSGYNIYRAVFATSCGSYSKINSTLNTSTLYADSSVVDGTNYCYATTAVNSSSEESGYSNIISNVQIPAP
jgi:hypothetical protein